VGILNPFPSVETLGYYQPSLRDASQIVLALGRAGSATGNDVSAQPEASPGGKMPPSTAGETPAATNVVIGLLLPETEPLGLSIRQGALLGIESLTNNTDYGSATLVIRGATGQWGTDGVEAARMVTDDGAQGLIAPPDGAGSHLTLQVAGRTAVPVISLCGDSSVTQTGVPWVVRIVPRTSEEAKAIFSGCKSKAKRWIVCVPEGRRGREITHDITEAAAKAGVILQTPIEVKWPITDPSLFCDRLLTNRAEGILLWLDPIPTASLLKLIRTAGFEGQLAGPSWLRCLEFENMAAMEGFVMPTPALDEQTNARFKCFASAFRTRFGREPDAMAAMSYDATQLLVEILHRANGRSAHEFFPVDFLFPGVTGVLSFDPQGNRKVELELREGRDGHLLCTAQDAQARRWRQ
jgi:ABC-type branched-subunit amino acid transport system substrate-binding protein